MEEGVGWYPILIHEPGGAKRRRRAAGRVSQAPNGNCLMVPITAASGAVACNLPPDPASQPPAEPGGVDADYQTSPPPVRDVLLASDGPAGAEPVAAPEFSGGGSGDAPAEPPPRRQLVSPTCLAAALALFLLPWTDLQCSGTTVLTQSGLQASYGGYSVTTDDGEQLRQVIEAERDAAEELQGEHIARKLDLRDRERTLFWAPMMIAYALLLATGTGVGFALRPGRQRVFLLGCCAALALLLLLVQTGVGFPPERLVEAAARMAQRDANALRVEEFPVPEEVDSAEAAAPVVHVRYTPWYWLALAATSASLVALGAEWWIHRRDMKFRRRRLFLEM